MPDRTFLQWPFFEPRHRELAARLEEWCVRELGDEAEEDADETCKELVQKLAAGGWLEFAAPKPGTALDVRCLCLIRETLARHSGLADFAFAMQGLGTGPVTLFGSGSGQSELLSQVRAGAKIAAFALSEAGAGSDVAALETTATRQGDRYVLNGSKTWISNGGIADFYVVFARTGEAPGAKGLSAFLVEASNPSLRVAERIQVSAPHPLASLELKDCDVPASALLGKPGEGFKVAMATLDVFRPTVGAAALGFARRALDESLNRCTKRHLFGAPLADMPVARAKLAEMA
jgi:acyl-CoA dehydrogenase